MENGIKKFVNVNNLFFDELNPRLPLNLQNVVDELRIIDYMIKFGNIDELMESIAVNGYSDAEPLLVVESKEKTGYIVVEGNRRLAAVKLLSNPKAAKVKIAKISAIVEGANYIPEDIPVIVYSSREVILDYLGYRHITGVKEWGSLEKARYLDQLYHNHKSDEKNIYSKLAKMIGSKPAYVLKLHQALKLYDLAIEEAFYGEDIDEQDISFSWIYTALGRSSVLQFLNIQESKDADLLTLNESNYKKLFVWLFGKKSKIKDSRQIKDLAEIISAPEAIEAFEKGAERDEAIVFTEGPSKAFTNFLVDAKNYMLQALNILPQLKEVPSESKDLVGNIKKSIKLIESGIEDNSDKERNSTDISTDDLKKVMELLKKMEGANVD